LQASEEKRAIKADHGAFSPQDAHVLVGANNAQLLRKTGPRILVAFADVVLDCFDELGHGVKGSAANALACDLGKPAFDLIQPRGAGRGKVKVITRVGAEPLLYLRMLVRAELSRMR
jgi:hypothetical protein